MYLGITKC